ncbi:MAG: hypothetical protein JNL69_07460 [Bacteroidia bacterium]|nr:hypothetical protein [Bacteroidia bacterium]
MHRIRQFENAHIALWLLKDTCWMMQWRVMGILMILPTVYVAVLITHKCWNLQRMEFWINLSICMWIMANSYWMCCEFFNAEHYKNYAGIPFVLGMIFVIIFYRKRWLLHKKSDNG